MAFAPSKNSIIVETEWGLTISGTRITLYDVMGYVDAGYTQAEIAESMELDSSEIQAALDYIEANQATVEAEYQEVVKSAEANRQYWEDRNRQHLAQVAAMPHNPEQDALRQKLKAAREQLDA
jgi:uncharacterized protein (DUF433 family)